MSDQAFQTAISFILPHENEYARGHWGDAAFVVTENVSGDAGGLTKYGIDAASHPGVNIAALDIAGATAIYHQEWRAHNLDALPDKLAICAFDVWVNGGHANLWLQHAYNEVMPTGTHLVEDGNLGPVSLAALSACPQINEMVGVFIAERNARFAAIATGPRAKFLAGWEQRDADLEKLLLA